MHGCCRGKEDLAPSRGVGMESIPGEAFPRRTNDGSQRAPIGGLMGVLPSRDLWPILAKNTLFFLFSRDAKRGSAYCNFQLPGLFDTEGCRSVAPLCPEDVPSRGDPIGWGKGRCCAFFLLPGPMIRARRHRSWRQEEEVGRGYEASSIATWSMFRFKAFLTLIA